MAFEECPPEAVFQNSAQVIDVRAPVEFARGSIPAAANLPLLTDDERAQVGTAYRHQGSAAAIALGHSLVAGQVKSSRVNRWLEEVSQSSGDALVSCARGGLRSKIACEWITEAGGRVSRVIGGYKAMRSVLLRDLADFEQCGRALLIQGRTGSGKTTLLSNLPPTISSLDLEKLANHRGSAFGSLGNQPAQATFENSVAVGLRSASFRDRRIVIEAESPSIGSCVIPRSVLSVMRASPVVVLEAPLDTRVANIFADYVAGPLCHDTPATIHGRLLNSIRMISRHLGPTSCEEISREIANAFSIEEKAAQISAHDPWIRMLLERYYDPLYDKHIQRSQDRTVFRGDRVAVCGFLEELLVSGDTHQDPDLRIPESCRRAT